MYIMYMTTLRMRVRSVKEVCCLNWGRRHLKLLVIASELLNKALQKRKLEGAEFTSP